MLRSMMAVLVCALALCACGDETAIVTDSGSDTDAGITVRTDAGSMRADAGPTDECAAQQTNAASTVGCNGGFLTSDPAPNAIGGVCTRGDEENPQGSCTEELTFCAGDSSATEGLCIVACPPASTYVSTGDCPTGFRCFPVTAEYGVCYIDCDATHPCPTGMECDREGSCVPEEVPMIDGGVIADGSVGDAGTGTSDPDASTGDPGVDPEE